jgi:hypothetical protein
MLSAPGPLRQVKSTPPWRPCARAENLMPKLTTNINASPPDDRQNRKKPVEPEPRCRPCPRCYVPLVLERQYRSRGLSGNETVHETYVCPACDARFQHSPGEGRWRELS